MRDAVRPCLVRLLAVALLATAACRKPETDIVATYTEDVGNFHVRSSDGGGVMTGYVCIEKRQYADQIVARILQQVANHSYRSVTLDVYGRQAAVARYVWTPAGIVRATTPDAANPCTSELDRS